MRTLGHTHLDWDESDLVEKIVNDLARVEEIYEVEWIQQSPHSSYQDLIRIETWRGAIFRLGLSWVEDEEVEEDFDDAFTHYLLQKSFEELGCSCNTQRQQLEDLEVQLHTEVLQFRSSLAKSPLGEAIATLKQEIDEIDLIEHPPLDTMAKDAYPYLDQWITEQESSEIEGLGSRALILRYAKEWLIGWRPRARS
ncbi:MAG: hypothetical protein F4X66_02495 [Chloroflexi bacterium]|nr:hypothetical protein [Chloroflexota bacterium]MYE40578.1 hypothetical protein [Chloroflexota bacterium]